MLHIQVYIDNNSIHILACNKKKLQRRSHGCYCEGNFKYTS